MQRRRRPRRSTAAIIIVGFDAALFDDTVRALYRHFVHDGDKPEPVS